MDQIEELLDIVEAIEKYNDQSIYQIDMLLTIATLLNELNSDRFRGVSYKKDFKFGRLSVKVEFDKYYGDK